MVQGYLTSTSTCTGRRTSGFPICQSVLQESRRHYKYGLSSGSHYDRHLYDERGVHIATQLKLFTLIKVGGEIGEVMLNVTGDPVLLSEDFP